MNINVDLSTQTTSRGARRFIVVVAFMTVLGVLAYRHWAGLTKETAPGATVIEDGKAPFQPGITGQSHDATGLADVRRPTPSSEYARTDTWVAEYGCGDCGPTWNMARSMEEAAWLHRNGFPARSEWQRLDKLSDRELTARFDAGDLSAGAVLGDRMLARRERGYMSFAFKVAARGSIYVLYRIAEVHRHYQDNSFMFSVAGAALRIAQMRGDYVAGLELDQHLPRLSAKVDRVRALGVDDQAAVTLRIIEEDRVKFGYPPLVMDLRPDVPAETQASITAERDGATGPRG